MNYKQWHTSVQLYLLLIFFFYVVKSSFTWGGENKVPLTAALVFKELQDEPKGFFS